MLPQTIINNLFDIKYHVDDMTLEYLSDEITKMGFKVIEIDNFDMVVYITFGINKLSGELCIDRLRREFQLSIINNDETYAPVVGAWCDIIRAFRELISTFSGSLS